MTVHRPRRFALHATRGYDARLRLGGIWMRIGPCRQCTEPAPATIIVCDAAISATRLPFSFLTVAVPMIAASAARAHAAGPAEDYPAERPRSATARLAALGLAEMRAVWRGVQPTDGVARAFGAWICMPNVLAKMQSVGMVGGVHADCCGVVIDADIWLAPDGLAQRLACAATTSEQVDHDLVAPQE